ncbi:aminotransferase class III-fold pyridoxal phosphate-dependent enzyme [Aestuariivivens sediminicola]|uniref:aminotransferase class III-fold pyridoxal phosphate-dependent enzyme n=1 Tax=Aestuariivivens sediminicola TaxID=2913560 RepID=UPI001F5ADF74|nr:aminotransferase class III-fold pyridoxal phosphate-dependent enzyme [Aestuariivivens sediminicola]
MTAEQSEALLLDLYNIKGSASPLPGEIDSNFRIKVSESEAYILKIAAPDTPSDHLEFQNALLHHIATHGSDLNAPRVIANALGGLISECYDSNENKRYVRLITWVPGRVWSAVNPQSDNLRFNLGRHCGMLTRILQEFDHEAAHRDFEWDIAQSLWTKHHLHLFSEEEQHILLGFQEQFEAALEPYSRLRKGLVHNDANDNNIIVSEDLKHPQVRALIDYGDAIHTQIINDLAIACSYAMMHHMDPLEAALPIVKGYHNSFPLVEEDLEHLYVAIAMRLVISVTKSAINKIKDPDNDYLNISEQPAWDLLKKWELISKEFATCSFRSACDFNAHPKEVTFSEWANSNTFYVTDLFPNVEINDIHHLDLSVSSGWMGHRKDFDDLELFEFKIHRLQKCVPNKIIAGGYLEPRIIYTSSAYDKIGNNGKESRTIHLGVDFWLPAGTPVSAICDGEIVIAINNAGDKEYGGLVVIKHCTDIMDFYTLYGHLSVQSVTMLKVGDHIKKGDIIGYLGSYPENGNWVPHLHFQILLSLLDYKDDYPGVAYYSQMGIWKSICPDPNLLFKIESLRKPSAISDEELMQYRQQHLGKNVSLQYDTPIRMVRGDGVYLIDPSGRNYLDTVNNVAHVGHENIRVVKAGQDQMALLNTNTRYLHEHITTLTKELLATMPSPLAVVYFVNSGSEANDLAIRMAKCATGERDFIVSASGYHGHTDTCIGLSSYKFDGEGGEGTPEYTHTFVMPDAYRGTYRGSDTAALYTAEVQKQIDAVHQKGRGVAGLILEPILSCGGQIELPKGFLKSVYMNIRAVGGLCISDEVQVGCGRVGKAFWGFQLHDVVPDIITIGKPLGNGHPLAAVVCTREVANSFANGMEYFNTFGGNPVSCAIGVEVLRIVKEEGLQEQAYRVGSFLKSKLQELASLYPIIGDVRGQGLFLGIELVNRHLRPLSDQTRYLINRMKDFGILMSIDGPDKNVLKIKPPMLFTEEHAEELVFYLKKILDEDVMKHAY